MATFRPTSGLWSRLPSPVFGGSDDCRHTDIMQCTTWIDDTDAISRILALFVSILQNLHYDLMLFVVTSPEVVNFPLDPAAEY